jgi:enamine deaminase RidA (YjgF/YER057c/UK114 family)
MSGTMAPPPPQGLYLAATRHGGLIFTAGMTPRLDGVLQSSGPVAADADPARYRDAVVLAARNALSAASARLAPGEHLSAILSLTVYVAAEPGFTAHSRLADFASEFLRAELGEHGVGSRAAVGVLTLPGNAPVEVQLVAAV